MEAGDFGKIRIKAQSKFCDGKTTYGWIIDISDGKIRYLDTDEVVCTASISQVKFEKEDSPLLVNNCNVPVKN